MKNIKHFWSYLAQFFLEWDVSDKIYRENRNPHFMLNNFSSKIVLFVLQCRNML